jgi:transposase
MYVGLDVHKRFCYATVLDQDGQKLAQGRFLNTLDELDCFLSGLASEAEIVMEASCTWEYLYDRITSQGFSVCLAHPTRTRAIAEARVKTDRIDSETLAQLLRADLIPKAYVPPQSVRDLRTLVRHRAALVWLQTQVKNRIHALLAKEGSMSPFSDLFGVQGARFLSQVELRPVHRFALDQYLILLEVLKKCIQESSACLAQQAREREEIPRLVTIPGIGVYSALLLLAEIGEVGRFPSAKKLYSYAGLVPRVYQSGQTQRMGRITKQGSKWLRWILVQAAHVAVRRPGVLQSFHRELVRRKGKKPALVATARKLLGYVYQVLKLGVSFEELEVNWSRASGAPALLSG